MSPSVSSERSADQSPEALTLGFRCPASARPDALRAWLEVLDGQSLPAGGSGSEQGRVNDGPAWLQQVLMLTRSLLHVLRIPLFEPIEVLQCRDIDPGNQRWEAVCRRPHRTLVSGSVLAGVIRLAFPLASWASRADVHSPLDREQFFRTIDEKILRGFAEAMPSGKSTFEVLRVAHRLGVPFLPLPGEIFQLGWGSHARRINRSTTDQDTAMGLRWTRSKLLSAQLLREAGLPFPLHLKAGSLEEAREAAERIGYPVVVKPEDLERGEGVSVDVQAEGLQAAFADAHQRSPGKSVLIERQVPGVCHRLFIAAGQLLYAVRRLPIGVYADGRSTLRDLVAAKRDAQQRIPPWKRSGIPSLDETALHMLQAHGWTPDSVPQAGQFVALRRIESTASGGVDEEITQSIHPDNVSAAIAATQIFGLEVAGVDMISPDIGRPWHANGAIINEVNFAPLLGGGEISRRYIGEYLNRILKNRGRIPVHAYAGGEEAWQMASRHWEELRAAGCHAYLTDEYRTLDAGGNHCALASSRLEARVQALLMRQEVQALVLVMHPSQALETMNRLAGAFGLQKFA